MSDGVEGGEFLDIFPYADPLHFTGIDDKMYFVAKWGDKHDLWERDGTVNNTHVPIDWPENIASLSKINEFDGDPLDYNGDLVIVAEYGGAYGNELWAIQFGQGSQGNVTEVNTNATASRSM